MKGWNEAMKFHERQVAKHNPREFLTRPAGLKPGSIMENGNIVTRSFGQGSIDSVAFGNIEIAAPVRIRRWKAYLDAGWKHVSWLLELTTDEATGVLPRSDEGSVGEECVSMCRHRWSPEESTKK